MEDVVRAGRREFRSQMSRCTWDYLSGYSEFYQGERPVFPAGQRHDNLMSFCPCFFALIPEELLLQTINYRSWEVLADRPFGGGKQVMSVQRFGRDKPSRDVFASIRDSDAVS